MYATSFPCVNQSLTIKSTQSQHLNFYTPNLLFPTAISVIRFDHHRVENTQVPGGKNINNKDRGERIQVVKKYQTKYD